jgi:uncharacterized protein (DUF305 family)
MARDHDQARFARIERDMVNLQKALGSQVTIVEQLRASHDHSIRMISDAIHHSERPDIRAILASLDQDPKRAD